MSNNFNYLNNIGKGTENIVNEVFNDLGFATVDVSNIRGYQKLDVDLLATKKIRR